MRRLGLWMAIVAFLLSILFAYNPGPYSTAAFAFVGVPFYLIAMIVYVYVVAQDLRGKGVF